MNILLVNFILQANHGGILQCYALQEVLKGMGHYVEKVDEIHKKKFHLSFHFVFAFFKRLLFRHILRRNTTAVFEEYYEDRANYFPRQNAERFINKYLNVVRVDSMAELDGTKYDAVIVGSDQVWRKPYTDKLLTQDTTSDNAFLAFTKDWDCKRIAYAASFGVDFWEYSLEETSVLKTLIKKFDAVSVREDSAIDLIHGYLGPEINVKHVLDPTLLLDKQRYIDLFKTAKVPQSPGNLLVYILDENEEKKQIVETISHKLELTPFIVNNPDFEKIHLPYQERIQTSIEQWLRGFYDAEFVIADSFHACVFSIIFNKPFVVIANKDRGITRIESLLKKTGLENRMIYSIDGINRVFSDIEWKIINDMLLKQKGEALSFINNALSS